MKSILKIILFIIFLENITNGQAITLLREGEIRVYILLG